MWWKIVRKIWIHSMCLLLLTAEKWSNGKIHCEASQHHMRWEKEKDTEHGWALDGLDRQPIWCAEYVLFLSFPDDKSSRKRIHRPARNNQTPAVWCIESKSVTDGQWYKAKCKIYWGCVSYADANTNYMHEARHMKIPNKNNLRSRILRIENALTGETCHFYEIQDKERRHVEWFGCVRDQHVRPCFVRSS